MSNIQTRCKGWGPVAKVGSVAKVDPAAKVGPAAKVSTRPQLAPPDDYLAMSIL